MHDKKKSNQPMQAIKNSQHQAEWGPRLYRGATASRLETTQSKRRRHSEKNDHTGKEATGKKFEDTKKIKKETPHAKRRQGQRFPKDHYPTLSKW